MAVVTLDRICKRYGAVSAVEDVCLDIADGEFMVLLGPSGCGKSTTLRMIAGLESISSGTLAIDGAPMNGVAAKDRDIAMVFQSYALYPHMTVRDNLAFGLRRRGLPRAEIASRVAGVAQTLGLSPLLARKPFALSGGQRQRVALGRAIVRDPKVFLFDEPLSNLDAALRVTMRGELIKLHRRLEATMVYVTHDQVEAMTMGTRICIMNGGRVVQTGRPLDVYRNPADTFVASFLGSPPMNLLPGRIEAGDGTATLHVAGSTVGLPPELPVPPGDVIFGIRPEDLSDVPLSGPWVRQLATEVVAVEPLGAETLLLLRPAGQETEFIARVGRDSMAEAGQRLDAYFDVTAAHFFDPGTKRSLTARS